MKISEKEFEDWLWKNSDELEYMTTPMRCLFRQVKLPHGILDLLFIAQNGLIIPIELKIGRLREEDIGQVLRYATDIELLVHHFRFDILPMGEKARANWSIREEILSDFFLHPVGLESRISPCPPLVYPILIGRSAGEQLISTCYGANIAVLIWNGTLESTCFNQALPAYTEKDREWQNNEPIRYACENFLRKGIEYTEQRLAREQYNEQ